jgi:SWI/SNF-related matrix-associated actin-dependent regulator of chromatin subfamily B protein 1
MGPPPSTFGKKPPAFDLNGELYYIGADIGNYLKCHRGKLYKHYPNMWRRVATADEKKKIQELSNNPNLSSNVMLVRATEVEEILAGNEEKYRNVGARHGTPTAASVTPNVRKDSTPLIFSARHTRSAGGGNWFNSHLAGGNQIETISTALPPCVGRGRLKHRENIYNVSDHTHLTSLSANASIPEELVPVRIDLDIDGLKIRDAFSYNKNETIITPEVFAECFCDDLEINNPQAVQQIAASIRQQISAYEELLPMEGAIDQRAQIKLNINVQNENLTDTVEWDIAEPKNSPEEFANHLCRDLQIGGEFIPSIACSIRGQIAFYRRTFAHSDTQLPVISGVHPLRSDNEMELFAPRIEVMSEADLDKKLRDSDRNSRRMRRLQSTPYGGY